MATRLTYVDILKGFTILWVVWMHMDLPSFIHPSVQMPVFFFLSGCFFKPRPFKEFIKKKVNTLIVPFLFFWFISYIYFVIKNEFIPCSFNLNDINWLNVINVWDKYFYGKISILWFLIGLFIMEMLWFFADKYSIKKIFLIISLFILYPIGGYLYAKQIFYPIPFVPIAHTLTFIPYYVIGAILGKKVLTICESSIKEKQNYIVLLISLFILAIIQFFPPKPIPYLIYIFPYTIAFIILALKIAFLVRNLKIMELLNFYGKNSIVVYTTHWQLIKWIVLPDYITTQTHYWIICVVEIFLILFFNKFLPIVIGKKALFK